MYIGRYTYLPSCTMEIAKPNHQWSLRDEAQAKRAFVALLGETKQEAQ